MSNPLQYCNFGDLVKHFIMDIFTLFENFLHYNRSLAKIFRCSLHSSGSYDIVKHFITTCQNHFKFFYIIKKVLQIYLLCTIVIVMMFRSIL